MLLKDGHLLWGVFFHNVKLPKRQYIAVQCDYGLLFFKKPGFIILYFLLYKIKSFFKKERHFALEFMH